MTANKMSAPKESLKEGVRVAVYGDAFNLWCDGYFATVEKVYESPHSPKLRVRCDDVTNDKRVDHVHPKQCRRLRPKKKLLRVECEVEWCGSPECVYPTSASFDWGILLDKRGTLTFVEDSK